MNNKPIPVMCLGIDLQITREPIKAMLLRLIDEDGNCRAMVPILPGDVMKIINNLRQARKLLRRGDA